VLVCHVVGPTYISKCLAQQSRLLRRNFHEHGLDCIAKESAVLVINEFGKHGSPALRFLIARQHPQSLLRVHHAISLEGPGPFTFTSSLSGGYVEDPVNPGNFISLGPGMPDPAADTFQA
jgi:hypothetical protein